MEWCCLLLQWRGLADRRVASRLQAGKDSAEQQTRLVEEMLRGLQHRMKDLELSHQAAAEQAARAKEDLLMHKKEQEQAQVLRAAQPPPPPPDAETDSIREEYEGLLKELTDAGLKDPGDVDHLLTAMKGPPATDANSVCRHACEV